MLIIILKYVLSVMTMFSVRNFRIYTCDLCSKTVINVFQFKFILKNNFSSTSLALEQVLPA